MLGKAAWDHKGLVPWGPPLLLGPRALLFPRRPLPLPLSPHRLSQRSHRRTAGRPTESHSVIGAHRPHALHSHAIACALWHTQHSPSSRYKSLNASFPTSFVVKTGLILWFLLPTAGRLWFRAAAHAGGSGPLSPSRAHGSASSGRV